MSIPHFVSKTTDDLSPEKRELLYEFAREYKVETDDPAYGLAILYLLSSPENTPIEVSVSEDVVERSIERALAGAIEVNLGEV
jgi:hypothetical protein